MTGPAAPDLLESTMLDLARRRGAGKTLDPTEVARAIGGDHPDGWGPLMPRIRQAAVRLMKQGKIVILRKGRPVDPDDFRGIYRIMLAPGPDSSGPGNRAVVRPER